ncbi:hypothetical protein SDJN02_26523, partial [Cucurbita argyrosperma subsp. argyrosperma]
MASDLIILCFLLVGLSFSPVISTNSEVMSQTMISVEQSLLMDPLLISRWK